MALLAAVVAVGMMPAIASASTTEAIAQTGGSSLTLGLPGSPINFAVTLDEFGNLVDLTVTDAGGSQTVTPTDGHEIKFVPSDGSMTVKVEAKGSEMETKIKALDAASVIGSHSWSADVFGTGETTTVDFSVAPGSSGYPVIASVDVTAAAGVTATVGSVENGGGEDEFGSEVRVTFSMNGYAKTLKIAVETHLATEDGSSDEASMPVTLKVELEAKDVQKLEGQDLSAITGAHTWTGLLCDGSTATFAYSITDGGLIVPGPVMIGGATAAAGTDYSLEMGEHGLELRFAGSDAKVKIELEQNEDGTWDLKVKSETTETCDNNAGDDHEKKSGDDHEDQQKDDGGHDGGSHDGGSHEDD